MQVPTGGSHSLIAQNGPIADHTADGDPFTSMLRDSVAADAAETLKARNATVQCAAKRIVIGIIGLFMYLLIENPCRLEAKVVTAPVGVRRRRPACRFGPSPSSSHYQPALRATSSGTESRLVQKLNWKRPPLTRTHGVVLAEEDMSISSYKQFCPVAMAAEILCTRWTVVLIRELVAGSTRFNELRRGVPRMSPALLSQRLKDLETAGIVARTPSASDPGVFEYQLTASGGELGPIVDAFGVWGQRRIEADLSLQHLDVPLLMWDMRRNLNTTPMPRRRNVVQFVYPELPAAQRSWWLIVDPQEGVDLCSIDPGFEVELYVSVDLRTMTAIWMGLDTVRAAVGSRRMLLTGNQQLASAMQTWLGLSPFAKEQKLAS